MKRLYPASSLFCVIFLAASLLISWPPAETAAEADDDCVHWEDDYATWTMCPKDSSSEGESSSEEYNSSSDCDAWGGYYGCSEPEESETEDPCELWGGYYCSTESYESYY